MKMRVEIELTKEVQEGVKTREWCMTAVVEQRWRGSERRGQRMRCGEFL